MTSLTKRVLLILAFCALATAYAGAQNAEGLKTYVKTLYIERIAPHSLGYQVTYQTSSGGLATTYIPMTWFNSTAGKGEIVYGDHPSVPYMMVVFQEGKFASVRLFLSPSYDRREWTTIPIGTDMAQKFNVDTLSLRF